MAQIDLGVSDADLFRGDDLFYSGLTEGLLWEGYDGNDTFSLGTGDDYIFGGSGIDTLIVNDSYANVSVDFYSGASGSINSASGYDYVSDVEIFVFNDETVSFTYLSGSGQGTRHTDSTINLATGSSLNQTITGDNDVDVILGMGGNDKLLGKKGNDTLDGDFGNDVLKGGAGHDELYGGSDNDRLIGGLGVDMLVAGSGRDNLIGGNARDTFVFDGNDDWNRVQDFGNGPDRIEIEGATDLSDLTFRQRGDNAVIKFEDTTIRVDNWDVEDLQNAEFFIF